MNNQFYNQKRECQLEIANQALADVNAELKVSEGTYRRLFESMMDAFVSVDMAGRIQDTNPAYQTMLGYSAAELKQLTYSDLTPEKWHAFEARIVSDQILKQGYSDLYEKEYRKKDGTIFPIELRTLLIRNDSGQPTGMWAIIRDISLRKQTEQALRESEMLLRESQLIANLGSYILDIETGAWKSSEVLDTLFGIGPSYERSVSGWIGMIHPDDRAMMEDYFKTCVLGLGRPFNKEYRIIRPDTGTTRWVHGMGRLEFDPLGRPRKMLGTVQDITEHKQAEEEREKIAEQLKQSQKMESIGRLAGGVAHDFNNMLGVILGHTEMAMEQVEKTAPLFADLEEINKAAQRSASLTRQLLAFGRKQIIAPIVIDLNDTVTGMHRMLRRLIGAEIDLVWQPGPELWQVKMDPSQIDMILVNLCINARDAIAGVGRLTLGTKNCAVDNIFCARNPGAVPGDYVVLSVSDSGSGMDKETLSHLFEPFFTTKAVGKGTGLGLSTVYGIITQNHGFINVSSEAGRGTTFTVYLPRYSEGAEPERAVAPITGGVPALYGNETLLLVEDEPTMMAMTKLMLEKHGYTVLAASTPDEALRLAGDPKSRINLLLTDVIMPEMNGRALANILQRLNPALQCLFMSAYPADVITHQGILNTDAHFIQKPFTRNALATRIREVLDGHR